MAIEREYSSFFLAISSVLSSEVTVFAVVISNLLTTNTLFARYIW